VRELLTVLMPVLLPAFNLDKAKIKKGPISTGLILILALIAGFAFRFVQSMAQLFLRNVQICKSDANKIFK